MSYRDCPQCAGHGVVSRQHATEVQPGVYAYEQRDVPCPRCDRQGWLKAAGRPSRAGVSN